MKKKHLFNPIGSIVLTFFYFLIVAPLIVLTALSFVHNFEISAKVFLILFLSLFASLMPIPILYLCWVYYSVDDANIVFGRSFFKKKIKISRINKITMGYIFIYEGNYKNLITEVYLLSDGVTTIYLPKNEFCYSLLLNIAKTNGISADIKRFDEE